MRIREIAETRVHYGYRLVHILLRRESWSDNHKRIYCLYRVQELLLHLKRPHRNEAAPVQQGSHPNHILGMDFASDALYDGCHLRLLTIIDLLIRECLGGCVGQNQRVGDVI